jgi:hypothetical protein
VRQVALQCESAGLAVVASAHSTSCVQLLASVLLPLHEQCLLTWTHACVYNTGLADARRNNVCHEFVLMSSSSNMHAPPGITGMLAPNQGLLLNAFTEGCAQAACTACMFTGLCRHQPSFA